MTGRKGKSVSQRQSLSGCEYNSNPCKKKRLNCTEQENLGSELEHNSDDEHVTTNALLMSLIKRLDRQEKWLSQMQQKMDQAVMPSSSSSGGTPSRASRHKEVSFEVRVSCKLFSVAYLEYSVKLSLYIPSKKLRQWPIQLESRCVMLKW